MKTFDCSFIDDAVTLISERVRAETRNKAKYQFLRTHFPNDKSFSRKIRIKTVTPDILEYEWRMRIVEDVIAQQQLKIEALRVTNKNLEEENEEMKTSIRADINNIIECNDKLQTKNEELTKKWEEEIKRSAYLQSQLDSDEFQASGKLIRDKKILEDRLSLLQEENIRLGSHLDETVLKFREDARKSKNIEDDLLSLSQRRGKENEDLCRLLVERDDKISELDRLLDQEQMRNIPSLLKKFFQKV